MPIDRQAPAARTRPRTLAAAEVPAPEPDVVPLPPSPHPTPPSPGAPPEIDEPIVPGEHVPVREPPAVPTQRQR